MTPWIADTPPDSTHRYYSRANAGEVMPNPVSPLGSSFVWAKHIAQGWRQFNVDMGIADMDEFELDRPNHFGVFAGYLYLNMSWTRIVGVRGPGMTPEMIDEQYYGDMPGIPSYASEARPGDESPPHTARMAAALAAMVAAEDLPQPRQDKARLDAIVEARPDLSMLTAADLVARARDLAGMGVHLFREHGVTSFGSGVAWAMVRGVCSAVGRPELSMSVAGVTGDLESAGPAEALWELGRLVRRSPVLTAAFDDGLDGLETRLTTCHDAAADEFRNGLAEALRRFGARGPNEWEIHSDCWETDPLLVLAAVDRLRLADDAQSPAASAIAANQRAAASRKELEELLSGNAEAAATVAAGIRCVSVYDAGRERTKTNFVRLIHELRLTFRELGHRAVEDGALASADLVFMLHADELDAFMENPAEFKAVLADRDVIYRGLFDLQPPFLVTERVPTIDTLLPRSRTADLAPTGTVLTGIPGSAGSATGRARVVTDPADPRGLEPGEILVATITSPAWTPLFVTAGAVVVEVGAQVSHAVIVSRELGIPCVVSVGDATTRIRDGANIAVDGSRGTVTILPD